MIKKLSLIAFFATSWLYGSCTDNGEVKQYGGHYYSITKERLTFTQAKVIAENMNGYLAIPNNSSENAFIESLIEGNSAAWIGVYDPQKQTNYCYEYTGTCANDDSRFRTIKNEMLTYTNWRSGEPNNMVLDTDVIDGEAQVQPLGEHWVTMFGNDGKWGDYGKHAGSSEVRFAVFEFEQAPECYIADDANATEITDFEKFCSSMIYDSSTQTLTQSYETVECLTDQYNTDYCPLALAPAGEYWDYADSTVYTHTDTVVDYATGTYAEHMGTVRDFVNGTSQPHTSTETVYNNGTSATFTSSVRDWTSGGDGGQLVLSYLVINRAGNGLYYSPIIATAKPSEARDYCSSLGSGWKLPDGCDTNGAGAVPRDGYEFVYTDTCVCGHHSYTLSTSADCKGYVFGWNDVRSFRCVNPSPVNAQWYNGQQVIFQQVVNVQQAGNGKYYTPILGSKTPTGARDYCSSLGSGWKLPDGCDTNGAGAVPRDGYEFVYTDTCVCGHHSYTLSTSADCKGYVFGWNDVRSFRCVNTTPTNVSFSCPTGYTYSGGKCYKTVTYNHYTYGCPTGYTPQNNGMTTCTKTDPNQSVRNDSTLDDSCNSPTPPANNCVAVLNQTAYEYVCGTGYIPINDGLTSCPSGTDGTCNSEFPPESNCYKDISYKYYEYECPSGYTIDNHGLTECTKTDPNLTVNNEATLNDDCNDAVPPEGNCQKNISYSYYEFACASNQNEFGEDYQIIDPGLTECERTDGDASSTNEALADSCNSLTIAEDNCQRLNFTCNSNMREPAWVDNQWQCSPYPCRSENNITDHTAQFSNQELNNNGWDQNGGCNGQIYIFDGDANRCRSWDLSEDALTVISATITAGMVGGAAVLSGLDQDYCCYNNTVYWGLMDCKSEEKMLGEKRENKMCHYVGEFCSKSIDVGFDDVCVQKSQSYCCYNSKLARIINVGAKAQLGKNFGTAKSPNCRGFTPEEFQRIDLSQIDLSEFINDIKADANVVAGSNAVNGVDTDQVINEQMQENLNNATQNLGNNIGTRLDSHFEGI